MKVLASWLSVLAIFGGFVFAMIEADRRNTRQLLDAGYCQAAVGVEQVAWRRCVDLGEIRPQPSAAQLGRLALPGARLINYYATDHDECVFVFEWPKDQGIQQLPAPAAWCVEAFGSR